MPRIERAAARSTPQATPIPISQGGGYAAPGRALQGFGNTLEGVGAHLQAEQEKQDTFETRAKLAEFYNQERLALDQATFNYQGDGKTFAPDHMTGFNQRLAALTQTLPASQQKQVALYTEQMRGQIGLGAQNFGQQKLTDYNIGLANQTVSSIAANSATDPASVQNGIAQAQTVIDQIPGLSESKRMKLREDAAKAVIGGFLKNPNVDPEQKALLLKELEQKVGKPEAKPQSGPIQYEPPPLQRKVGRPRTEQIKGIVMHQTEGSVSMQGNGSWSNKTNTGAHYYIGQDGKVYQWAPDDIAMNHAGKGRGKSGDIRPDLLNGNTIGIEIMTRPGQKPNATQVQVASALTQQLMQRYNLGAKDVVGHGEVAVGHRGAEEGMDVVRVIRGEGGQSQPEFTRRAGVLAPVRVAGSLTTEPTLVREGVSDNSKLPPDAQQSGAQSVRQNDSQTFASTNPQGMSGTLNNNGLASVLPSYRAELSKQIASQLDDMEKGAMAGYPMVTDKLKAAVDVLGDPALTQKMQKLETLQGIFTDIQNRPPAANEQMMQEVEARIRKAGTPTPQQLELKKSMEEAVSKQRQMLASDKLSYAQSVGNVDVGPLNPDDPDSMRARLDHAMQASAIYGGGLQFFTKAERDRMEAALKNGGEGILEFSAALSKAWGPVHASAALKEISTKIPEAAIAGYLYINGQTKAAQDIASILKARQDPNYKPNVPSELDKGSTVESVLGRVYDRFPPQQKDAVVRAADAIYEARQKKAGASFDSTLYKTALQEVIGQRTDNQGNQFGGIVDTKAGMIWGHSGDQVVIPMTWRTSTFKEVLQSITADDMKEAGQQMPLDANGRALSLTKVMNGSLVQIGPEQYMVALGDANTPGAEKYVMGSFNSLEDEQAGSDGPSPFILDLSKLEPILKRRYPSKFWSE